jgi:hypothetical protein
MTGDEEIGKNPCPVLRAGSVWRPGRWEGTGRVSAVTATLPPPLPMHLAVVRPGASGMRPAVLLLEARSGMARVGHYGEPVEGVSL